MLARAGHIKVNMPSGKKQAPGPSAQPDTIPATEGGRNAHTGHFNIIHDADADINAGNQAAGNVEFAARSPAPESEAKPRTSLDSTYRQLGAGGPPSVAATSSHGGHGSQADPSDRVFPIRSVVSVNAPRATSGPTDYFGRIPSENIERRSGRRASVATDLGRDLESPPLRSPTAPDSSAAATGSRSSGTPPKSTPPAGRRAGVTRGPLSKISADAERANTVEPLAVFAHEIDGDEESDEDQPADNSSAKSGKSYKEDPSLGPMGQKEAPLENFMTARFRHVVDEDGHAVITGREGTLERCEDEPIHAPGAVQSFGALLALKEESDGRFTVRYVSENSLRVIGFSPQHLFQLHNFMDIMSDEQADNLMDHIDFIRDEDADPAVNGPEVFGISIKPPRKPSLKLWMAIHIHPGNDLLICEFEQDDDKEYPLRPAGDTTPDLPKDTLQANPTMEELTESTENLSQPLRVLRSARKRRGQAGALQVFDIMSQVQQQLAMAQDLEVFLKILVGIVKELTGFHRVMIYQFDSLFNGKVVTELVDTAQTRDLYKGLHFPASDIPKQARELYKVNKVRLLYDRDMQTARMVCRSVKDLETPLDMTHSYLRAMSPIHLKYLANMAVRSSMSISINAFNELWGLIACHSYGSKGMRVSFPIRKMSRLIGDTASRNIERLSYASRLQARKLINTVPTDKNPSGYIIASSEDLLKLFDADFGMLCIRGETKILGKLEQSQEALAMLEYLRLRKLKSVLTSQDVTQDFPDLSYPPGFSVIAGMLYVPLSVSGNDFIIFFRKGQIREVKWAGNPYEKVVRQGTSAYLEPRKSFKTWHETVVGTSRDWTEPQVETAAVLCLVYGKFIEVWRQKEAALQSSKLTRLLLANSAHEVRTPLNAIINYLEIALEGSLDKETRDNLAKSHSASKSLIYVINDLLDLTMAEEGQDLVKYELFDLPACIRDAAEAFSPEASRKGIKYKVGEHPGTPRFVHGDQRRIRQIVANLTANAVQHTSEGSVSIEVYVVELTEGKVRVEVAVEDTGTGMSVRTVDDLFRDLEQVQTDGDDDEPLVENAQGKAESPRTLGLGLAVVARTVRNMDGQLRLKSEEGKGSRFVIQLPFELPADQNTPPPPGSKSAEAASATPDQTPPSVSTAAQSSHAGEILLVDRDMTPKEPTPTHRDDAASISSHRSQRSVGSKASVRSKASANSAASDADRLIHAIQTPLNVGSPEPARTSLQRKNSKGPYYRADQRPSIADSSGSKPDGILKGASTFPSAVAVAAAEDAGVGPAAHEPPQGMEYVTDSKTPIKPVKIPDQYDDMPEKPQQATDSRVLYEIPDHASGAQHAKHPAPRPPRPGLKVLIAEDDPVNYKLLSKRLEKAGHSVHHAVNGEQCAQAYREKAQDFDLVLMDMQMPIVDGLTSTKMIRAFEHSDDHPGLSELATRHSRIPVFAVSASLVEREKDNYIDAGFDAWVLKPIDFKRLEKLIRGIGDDGVRNELLYVPGEWERGGWFRKRTELPTLEKATSVDPPTPEEIRSGTSLVGDLEADDGESAKGSSTVASSK